MVQSPTIRNRLRDLRHMYTDRTYPEARYEKHLSPTERLNLKPSWDTHREKDNIIVEYTEHPNDELDALLSSCVPVYNCLLFRNKHNDVFRELIAIHGIQITTSRFVCLLHRGLPPNPLMVAAHNCSDGTCCNPAHIFWRTTAQNGLDMSYMRKWPKGNASEIYVSLLLRPDKQDFFPPHIDVTKRLP